MAPGVLWRSKLGHGLGHMPDVDGGRRTQLPRDDVVTKRNATKVSARQ
jgi:hypothetical protein